MTDRSVPLAFTRRALLLSTAAVAALGAAPTFTFAQEPVRGGTLTFNVGAEPPVFVSATNTGTAIYVGPKVVEGLIRLDLDFNPHPQLATEWSVSDDGLVYAFKLRQGVKWHDGEDFTAEDVAFSVLALKEEHPRGRGTFANVTAVNVIDTHTVEIVLSHPAPFLLKALIALETPILPRHIFQGGDLGSNPVLNAPIGTGPFVFKEWIRGSHILLERNPDYWDEGKPYLDQLIIRFLNDPAATSAALETGEVLVSFGGVPLTDIDRLQQNERLSIETRGSGYINSIARLLINLDRPHLKDVRVRQALAHAIDRQLIVNTVYLGHATALDGPINPKVTEFFYPDLPRYDFDPARAEALLDEAGYPRGADGVRFSLFIDPHHTSGPLRQSAEYIAQALGRVGISTELRVQDWGAFVKRLYTDRDFDLATESMSNLFDPTVGVQRLYWSKNFKPGVPFSNGPNYSNPEVDRLLEEAAYEIDAERRYDLFVEFQKHIVHDIPTLNLVAPDVFIIHDKRVHNLVTSIEGVASNGAEIFIAG